MSMPNHLIYSSCIFVGAAVCFCCAFVVGHSHVLAILCFVLSNVCLTAAGSIPYGIVAVWNKEAEQKGRAGSVAMQMAILNCCITVGQQLCTMILGSLESLTDVAGALRYLYAISMGANLFGAFAALLLKPGTKQAVSTEESGTETSSSETES